MSETCRNHEDMPPVPRKMMEQEGMGLLLRSEFACLPIHTETQIKGKKNSGDVFHISQLHASPFDGEKGAAITIEHQKMIFKELEKIRPKYLIIEGDNGQFKEILEKASATDKRNMSIEDPRIDTSVYIL